MLADPHSGTIRAFGMIDPDNSTDNSPEYGDRDTAYPGYFWIDRSGVVRERSVLAVASTSPRAGGGCGPAACVL